MGLLRYTVWRCLQAIPVLVGILTITFFLTNAIPGDPVSIMLGPTPSAEMVEQIQARYGLDRPLHERYFSYLAGVAQGDLGHSIYYDVPVLTKIIERLPVTAYLVFSAFGFALLTAIPLGVISAKRRNEPVDHVSRIVALIGVSTPSFWIGLLLIIVFSFQLGLLPATGLFLPWADPANVRGAATQFDVVVESFKRLLMPMVALGTLQMASITRIERSSMVDSLQNEYVKLARAYGVDERGVIWKHAFKPAQLPVITIVGLGLSTALGGAVLIETVFEINGMGRLIIQAINNQDYPLVMGTTFMLGALYLVGVIITDISYAYIDPRVSYGEK
ncbi:oligopeptide transporter permease [Halalkalicoccus paucihalophilus]|uniref:Oligopeptide transporter permease n=1 Tax=Halalkalicoccus paucihalophilus TaxID=1008153 RepID=A0A151AH00_9EURY|nr:ABC transporter permease [Halalkalicoccus paucihalophilus]KYH26893.1 oligopeptide transporter permease [Halalkalicoccus paucihalophilus]